MSPIYKIYAILPSFIEPNRSEIVTKDGRYFSKRTPREWMDRLCLHTFSTVEGRRKVTKRLTGFTKKLPIIVEPCKVGAFPTHSFDDPNNMFIFQHTFQLKKTSDETRVIFPNGDWILVDRSPYVLQMQHQRLHILLSYCEQWKKETHYIEEDFRRLYH